MAQNNVIAKMWNEDDSIQLVIVDNRLIALSGYNPDTSLYTECFEVDKDDESKILREHMVLAAEHDINGDGEYDIVGFKIENVGQHVEEMVTDKAEKKLYGYVALQKKAKEICEGLAVDGDKAKTQNFLDSLLKNRNRSLNNNLLIYGADEHTLMLKSYADWQEVGRQVKRGEKGIAVISTNKDENGDKKTTVAYLFDVKQTEGKQRVEEYLHERRNELSNTQDLYEVMKRATRFKVEEKPIDRDGVNSYYLYSSKTIVIKDGLNIEDKCLALAKELSRATMEYPNMRKETGYDEKQFAVDAGAYSLVNKFMPEGYIDEIDVKWSDVGVTEANVLYNTLKDIQESTNKLIYQIDRTLEEMSLNKETDVSKDLTNTYIDNIEALNKAIAQNESIRVKDSNGVVHKIHIEGISEDVINVCFEREDNPNEKTTIMASADRENVFVEYFGDTLKHDMEIDLDREKSRENLGHKDHQEDITTLHNYEKQYNATDSQILTEEIDGKIKLREGVSFTEMGVSLLMYASMEKTENKFTPMQEQLKAARNKSEKIEQEKNVKSTEKEQPTSSVEK